MKAKEFRSKKYGDQRHLFSDQDQEFIDQMMEEYASQPAVSEDVAISALRNIVSPILYLEDIAEKDGAKLDGYMAVQLIKNANFYQGIAKKALDQIQSLNVQGDAQPRYDCDTCRYYPCASKHKVKKDGCGDYDATTKR